MHWITANDLQRWGAGIQARTELPGLIKQLLLASIADMTRLRFPSGDNAQLPGWDGILEARPSASFKAYVPDDISAWEIGTDQKVERKAEADYRKRTADPGPGVDPFETTFVFVTPHIWTGATAWVAAKKADSAWKDVRVIDAIQLEDWFLLCPAVAARFARENGFAPVTGALSVAEFWETYSRRFDPPLKEAVLLAGREAKSRELLGSLAERAGVQRWMGDSLDEVLGFVCAAILSAPEAERDFFLTRTLIVESEHAAQQLRGKNGTIFALRGAAKDMAGSLESQHRVILPVGRESIRSASSMTLPRATTFEMSEALKAMGLAAEKASQLAHEFGRSVSVLARRIPSGDPAPCSWRNDAVLLPAFLAGAWDRSCDADKVALAALAGVQTYGEFESVLRSYLTRADGPLELVDSVWAVRAPVDMFAQMSHLLQESLWERFSTAIDVVLAELDPALEMPMSERMHADLRGVRLRHSKWLRDGIATTLPIFAALGDRHEVRIDGLSPQEFVNRIVGRLPGLRRDHRLIASLSKQLPMLMEAAPDPFLSALEHLLEGDGARMVPIFQDSKESFSVWTSSPHTGLLGRWRWLGATPTTSRRQSWFWRGSLQSTQAASIPIDL